MTDRQTNQPTDQQTNQPTDRQTDRQGHREFKPPIRIELLTKEYCIIMFVE